MNNQNCLLHRLPIPLTRTIALSVLFFISLTSYSQLLQLPLERAASDASKTISTGRTSAEVLDLPFWDDFSSTPLYNQNVTGSGYPSTKLWTEGSNNVWVNVGAGINPPSVNVATLDGLNSLGIPYSTQETANGYRDVLTSNPIDLSLAKVSLAERPSVYLSFFFQWQGNGEAPDNGDFFRVEFLNATGVWETVMTINTQSTFDRTVFYDTIRGIQEERFFHDKFQFRFRNYGRLYGPYDTWNIDYVYLNKNRTSLDIGRQEGTFASGISPIFGNYSSAPYHHFKVSPVAAKPQIDVFNLYTLPSGYPMTYSFTATFDNFSNGVKTTQVYSKTDQEVKENTTQANMNVYERYKANVSLFPTPGDNNPEITLPFNTAFNPLADSVYVDLSLTLDADDVGDLVSNDTVSAFFKLTDYYAYDDGSAEYAAVLNESDDILAYRFDMLTDQPDILVGFDIYVPQYSVNNFTSTEFFVMEAFNGQPARENGTDKRLTTRTTSIQKTSRDRFQRIDIQPTLVQGSFFIGWTGSTTTPLRVGLDYSNSTVDRIFIDTDGTWQVNTGLRGGSLMVRPVFGTGGPVNGIEDEKTSMVYPNPSQGLFYIQGRVADLSILSITGQSVSFTSSFEDDRTRIEILGGSAGLYILRFKAGSVSVVRKLVLR